MLPAEKQNRSNSETKRERFIRIAERRVSKILSDFDSLAKCADRKNYEYNKDDVDKIFKAIDAKIKDIKSIYRGTDKKNNKFSLRNS